MAVETEIEYLASPGLWKPSGVLPLRHTDGRVGCLHGSYGPKVFLVAADELDMYLVKRDKVEYEQ